MDYAISIVMGVSLAAACGFRVFLPMLVASLSAWAGVYDLAPDMAWAASPAAMITLGVAAVVEIGAMHIPWLDHLLDTIASPSAVVAGALVAASAMGDLDPTVRWTAALIAGGGAAGAVQATTVAVRATSSAMTGGLANPVVASAEAGASLVTSLLAVFAPFLALAGLAFGGWAAYRVVTAVAAKVS